MKLTPIISSALIATGLAVGGMSVGTALDDAGTPTEITSAVVELTAENTKYAPIERKEDLGERLSGFLSRPPSPDDVIADTVKYSGHLEEIDGGLWFNTGVGVPPCDESMRGAMWYIAGADGFDDKLLFCARDAKGESAWRPIQL